MISGFDRAFTGRMSRRAVLRAAAACAMVAATKFALGQPPAPVRPKGPRVFLDYDQAALDAAYDQNVHALKLKDVTRRYAANSEATRARIGAPLRAYYGMSEVEQLDIYRTTRPGAPINLFIHGDAWRTGLAKDYAFPAEMFVRAGAHFVVPDFVQVQDAGGNLMTMAQQVLRAIAWVYRNAAGFGGDPDRIYLSGHSSGAHLAGVALTTDWEKMLQLPNEILKGGLLCSGLYDLKPVRLSARRNYVRFDDEMEQAMSPQRHIARLAAPLVIAYGALETPEFQRQSREFAEAVRRSGKRVQLLVGAGYNHFEILETLASPYGLLGAAALEQMKLGAA